MRWFSSDTHGTRSSSSFHSIASPPPGRRTRAISSRARGTSNQWNAWPDHDGVERRPGEREVLGDAVESLHLGEA